MKERMGGGGGDRQLSEIVTSRTEQRILISCFVHAPGLIKLLFHSQFSLHFFVERPSKWN